MPTLYLLQSVANARKDTHSHTHVRIITHANNTAKTLYPISIRIFPIVELSLDDDFCYDHRPIIETFIKIEFSLHSKCHQNEFRKSKRIGRL